MDVYHNGTIAKRDFMKRRSKVFYDEGNWDEYS